ncbi:MAG TPA: alpha/beta hydrolase family protein [Pyrinomonadaceae bacterium]|nr:alpha/beta hydrolase family protein [Pyrinomonadaceae bacterium]
MLKRRIQLKERQLATRDTNRIVRPFEWGASFIAEHANGDDPRELLAAYAERAVASSDAFYALPHVTDYRLDGDELTWTSAVETPSPENNTAHARFFRELTITGKENDTRRAVVVLPEWNAQPRSHVELCRILTRFGIAALRLTLPYHGSRRPRELERADHLVSSNVGRTLQSMRQAVLDTRAAIEWLRAQGYERIGIMGTSIGSCVGFLALVHDPLVRTGVFNHVSGYVADVAWRGISTAHVRAGFGDAVTLEELRRYWLPISPLAYSDKLGQLPPRPIRFIAARYDLTFPEDLSRAAIDGVRNTGHPLDTVWLRCGHYTLGQSPWKYIDGWKIVTFLRRHL